MSEVSHGSYYYPQAAILLRVRFEDFGKKNSGIASQYFDIKCLARNLSVTINDYTQADTFECEIDYKYFPFDPRSIRAVAVTIAIKDMEKLEVDTNKFTAFDFKKDDVVFIGFADEESLSFDDNHKKVKLEGRDFTAVLIDEKFLRGAIDVTKPVDQVVRDLLQNLESTKDLKVEIRPSTLELPELSKFWSDIEDMSGKKNTGKNQNYWDVINSIVADAGLIAFIELDTLVITKPREVYDQKGNSPTFIYGRNIKNLEFKRKVGRKKGFNIIVRCLDVENKEVLEAKIPLEATEEWSKQSGIALGEVKIPKRATVTGINDANGAKPTGTTTKPVETVSKTDEETAPYMSFRVTNVNSKAALISIGENIYEEMSRQQIEGSFETHEMKLQVNGQIFNLLKLRNGTPIAIELDFKDSKIQEQTSSVNEIESRLKKVGYDPRTANTLSKSLNLIKKKFYTKSVNFRFDAEQGFSVAVEFLNFITVEKDQNEKT